MIPDCTAIILTGGDSRRMGQDKANLLWHERSLLQHVISLVQPLFSEVIISVRQPRANICLPQVCDDPVHRGPLGGLLAGLAKANTAWVFLVACDMPFITPRVVEYLAQQRREHQAVVPFVQGHPQPMAGFYAQSCLEPLRALLHDASAKHSLRALLERLDTHYVAEAELQPADPQLKSFFDLDTPQDFAAAQTRQGEV